MKAFNLVLLTLVLFLNCKKESSQVKNELIYDNYLEIYYLQAGLHFPATINCDMIRSKGFKRFRTESKITDQLFVNKFLKLYKKYKPLDKKPEHDTRIQILVHQGSKVDMLCLGEYFFTSINGSRMEDSPELLALIKNKLKMED